MKLTVRTIVILAFFNVAAAKLRGGAAARQLIAKTDELETNSKGDGCVEGEFRPKTCYRDLVALEEAKDWALSTTKASKSFVDSDVLDDRRRRLMWDYICEELGSLCEITPEITPEPNPGPTPKFTFTFVGSGYCADDSNGYNAPNRCIAPLRYDHHHTDEECFELANEFAEDNMIGVENGGGLCVLLYPSYGIDGLSCPSVWQTDVVPGKSFTTITKADSSDDLPMKCFKVE